MHRICLIVAVCAITAASLLADEQATITIRDQVIRPHLSPVEFCGVNWEYTGYLHTLRHIWNNCYKEFIDFLKANGLHTFRYPGGGNVSHFYPGVPGAAWYKQFMETATGPYAQDDWIEYEEFLRFLADGDFRAIIQLNTFSAFDPRTSRIRPLLTKDKQLDGEALQLAAQAAAWAVQYAKDNDLARYIAYWEIGNEEYFTYTPQQYGRIVSEFIDRMRQVAPDIHFLVTTQWSPLLVGRRGALFGGTRLEQCKHNLCQPRICLGHERPDAHGLRRVAALRGDQSHRSP